MTGWDAVWFFIISFTIAAALPGAGQGALIAQVMSRGGRNAVPFAIGMVSGNFLWLTAAVLGLSQLALRFEPVFIAVKWLGVAYLIFLAFRLWNAGAMPSVPRETDKAQGFLSGAFLTIGNPKAVVFFGAILPHAFDMGALSLQQLSFILIGGVSIDLAVQTVYVLVAERARRLVQSERHMRIVNRGSAGIITGSAVMIASRT